MKTDPEAPFAVTPPRPNPKAMEEAWASAVYEFHRSQRATSNDSQPNTPIRWIWPLAAVATIAILCGLLVTRPTISESAPSQTGTMTKPDLAQLYNQGRQLFGDKLEAVTVSKNQVIWHLSEAQTQPNRSDQLVTLTLNHKRSPRLYIATSPGTPLDIQYQDEIHQVEFLPNASDQIIAIGDGIFWDSDQPGSPMSDLQIQHIQN